MAWILPAITATPTALGPILFFDRFSTDIANPLPATFSANPGPGTWTAGADPNGVHSVTGGKFVIAENGQTGLHGIFSGLFAHAPGRMYSAVYSRVYLGTALGDHTLGGIDGWLRTPSGPVSGAYTIGHQLCFIRSQTGFLYVVSKTTNRLEWVSAYGTVNTNPMGMTLCANGIDAANFDDAIIADLAAPWTTDFGIASAYDLTADAGTILADAPADVLLEATWQAATDAVLNLMFRRTDDSNCYTVRCDQAAGTAVLVKIEGGSETALATKTGLTWTNGTKYRIVVKAVGTVVDVWIANVRQLNKTANTFNQTTTGAKVDLAVENFIAWPSLISGGALTALEAPFPTS